MQSEINRAACCGRFFCCMNTWRKTHDSRRGNRPYQRGRGQVRRFSFHGHDWQRTTRNRARPHDRRRSVRRRQDVRRLVDLWLEGHQRVRHDPDAGPGIGRSRHLSRRDDAEPALRRRRAGDDAGLRSLPALARAARRGLPAVDRRCGCRVLRAGERVLRVRQRDLGRHDAGRVLQGRFRGRRLEHRSQLRRRQHGPPPDRQGRLLPGTAG